MRAMLRTYKQQLLCLSICEHPTRVLVCNIFLAYFVAQENLSPMSRALLRAMLRKILKTIMTMLRAIHVEDNDGDNVEDNDEGNVEGNDGAIMRTM